ncbi:hypothetical protein REPUB_Repub04eG0079300 [Reevesia pubescens]
MCIGVMVEETTVVVLCTHAVEYGVNDNTGNSGGGVRFRNEIGVCYSLQTLGSAIDFIWTIFQQNNPADRKDEQKVTLFIENGDGVAFAVNNEIHVNANYLGNYSGQGDRWDQGYDVTARFLDYCNNLNDGFVAELNKKMRIGYSATYFVDLLGKTVDQLWSDYKAKYGN